jgi:[acyl-carrier-protein] S-malonyltransferase
MGEDLYNHVSYSRQVFDQVEQATGVNIANLCFNSDEETLRQTQNAQLALYTCGLAAYYALKDSCPDLSVSCFAGHSVGEYAALAAAGVVSLETGARLVQRRGDIMARAGELRPGAMAAVLGLDRDEIGRALAEVSSGVVVIANDNCPGQLVISGDRDAVAEATAVLNQRGARRVLPLNVSGAFHSPLMDSSAESMRVALDEVKFHSGATVYSNVTTKPGSHWADLLERQLKSPVLWTESIQEMIKDGVSTFIECGAGEVLIGLVRRIEKDAVGLRVLDTATLDETKLALAE